jgi:hypothetical protein
MEAFQWAHAHTPSPRHFPAPTSRNGSQTGHSNQHEWEGTKVVHGNPKRVAASDRYLVFFVAAALLSSVAVAWVALNPRPDPLTIPPGETRGMIAVCYSTGPPAWIRVTIDGVERANGSLGPRFTGCMYPLFPSGNHTVSVSCGYQSWSTNVSLSSRQVVQLPALGQSYAC